MKTSNVTRLAQSLFADESGQDLIELCARRCSDCARRDCGHEEPLQQDQQRIQHRRQQPLKVTFVSLTYFARLIGQE
jgi:hypothetical protein